MDQQQQLMIISGVVVSVVVVIVIIYYMTSGPRYERMDGFDYPGNDIECLSNKDLSGKECKTKCDSNENCKGYITGDWGCCYKHTLANKSPYTLGPFFTKLK